MFRVYFVSQDTTVEVEGGTTILEAEIAAGLTPDAPCGGAGVCGKCLCDILENGEKVTVKACQTVVDRDLEVITASAAEGHKILTEGAGVIDSLSPMVRAEVITVSKATTASPTSDWKRLSAAFRDKFGTNPKPDVEIANGLSDIFEKTDYTPEAVACGDELLALRKTGGRLLTAAVDIGTTSVVLYLADGRTGETIATESMLNPQTEFGADVISRASAAMNGKLGDLSNAIRSAVNGLLKTALSRENLASDDVYSVTLVGNTCMHHLFLGIDPKSLVLSPYVPAIDTPLCLDAKDYGIDINGRGKLIFLPCIAGFVGADTAAVMASCEFDRREKLTLAIDIGTNGEMVLGDKNRMVACSTAAGPAFEGAKITFGMRGSEGAVDHAFLENGRLRLSVIGGGKIKGVCGSGLLDITACLLRAGVLDETGRIADEDEIEDEYADLASRLATVEKMRVFILADETESANGQIVYLSQKDIREVQLAKGAMAAGISLMLEHLGRRTWDIADVLIAGAFGSYMKPESACEIGLIPPELLSRIKAVGNAAGSGALLCALNRGLFERTAKMAETAEFIELAANPHFQDVFVEKLMFSEDE